MYDKLMLSGKDIPLHEGKGEVDSDDQDEDSEDSRTGPSQQVEGTQHDGTSAPPE